MIIYFTGTGNSKYVADRLGDKLGDEVISLNDILKNDKPRSFTSEKPYVIVGPIYAWRIAPVVNDFIKEAEFNGNKKVYVVATMGSQTGKADKYMGETMAGKDVEYMGFTGIAMVDNYVNFGKMADADTTKAKIAAATPNIDFVADLIKAGRQIADSKDNKGGLSGIKSGFINNMFTKHLNDPGLKVLDDCIGCGKCEQICPVNNITMTGGKPVFGKNCLTCYGCLHHCPKAAIDVKGKVKKNGQYVCPEYVKEN